MMKTIVILSQFLALVLYVQGHGRVMYPPNRSSMWRFGFDMPVNYDDDGLNCGGYLTQWNANNGSCGVCGDNYADPIPRRNEEGGFYGRGLIGATFKRGQEIPVSVEITTNHLGWFEFRLCPQNAALTPTTQECLDQHLLEIVGSGTRQSIGSDNGFYNLTLRLPEDVVCVRCVLQWHYNTGNSWGTCPDGTGALGCGPQETFRTCSDIAILDN